MPVFTEATQEGNNTFTGTDTFAGSISSAGLVSSGAITAPSLAINGGTVLTTSNQTGSGLLVLQTSPVLTTPTIGVAIGTSLALGGGTVLSTTNQTGTGSLVLATSPTIATPSVSGGTFTSPTLVTPNIGVASGTSLTMNAAVGTGAALTVGGTSTTTGGISIFTGALGAATERFAVYPADGASGATRIGALSVRTVAAGFLTGAETASITAAGQHLSNGSQSAPAHSYTSEAGSGWFWQQAGIQGLARTGTYLLQVNGTQFTFGTGQVVAFSNGAPNAVSPDVGISRFGAGAIGIGTGGAGAVDGTLRVAKTGAIRWAENFAGADCGAKINAADTDFGGLPGEIWVSQLCGTTLSTTLALTAGRTVRFVQGGIYSVSSSITLGAGQCLIGIGEHSTSTGNEVVLKATNSSNLAYVVGTGSGNACVRDITIDGNKTNNTSGGVGLKLVDAGRFEASNVTVQNAPSHGVWIFSTGTGDLSCCGKYHRMFVFSNNGNGFYSQGSADIFVDGQFEVEQNGIDAVVNCATNTCTFVSGTVWANNNASLAGTHALLNGSTVTVSSVTSTTMVFTSTVGTLTGVHLYSGYGFELMDSPTWRIRNGDIGGNAAGGILITGTDAGLQSNEEMISNNQFGNNLGYDIATFGFGGAVYVATAHTIVGNLFIGCGGVGTCQPNTFAMIAMNDDKNSTIVGNTFDNHAGVKKSYGVQMTESAAGRNINTRISSNSYGNNLGTANTNCLTSSSGGQCVSDSTRATTIICPSQGQAAGIVGNSTDLTVFSCTIPAWTLGLVRSIKVHTGWNHTAGAATVTYKAFYGANSAQIASSALAGEASGIFYVQASAATNAQTIITDPFYTGTTVVGGITRTGIATDSTAAQTLKVTFNVAATDTVTPTEFWAELIY